MSRHTAVVSEHESSEGSVQTYLIGYALSLICTFGAYFLTAYHLNSRHETISHQGLAAALIALALSQLFVQLVFFLHLNRESKPRWNITVFAFMVLIVVIVVLGSMWIMAHLDYHHGPHGESLTPSQTDEYLMHEEGIKHSH